MHFKRPDAENASMLRSTIWNIVALLFGWTLFFYWWRVVLDDTTRSTFVDLMLGLAIVITSLFLFSVAWILHNLRLASNGRRSQSTRYESGVITRDKFDRQIEMADVHTLRDAAIVTIHSTRGQKKYETGVRRTDA